MFSTKMKLVAIAVVVCIVLGILGGCLLSEQPQRQSGQLLSDRDMATTFGDRTANDLCSSKQTCVCKRTAKISGQAGCCYYCDDGMGGGEDTTWYTCCKGITKYCDESGNNACGNLKMYWVCNLVVSVASCCNQCDSTSEFTTDNKACQPRYNVSENSDGC